MLYMFVIYASVYASIYGFWYMLIYFTYGRFHLGIAKFWPTTLAKLSGSPLPVGPENAHMTSLSDKLFFKKNQRKRRIFLAWMVKRWEKCPFLGGRLKPVWRTWQKVLRSEKWLPSDVPYPKCTFSRVKRTPCEFAIILAPFWPFLGSLSTI